MVMFDPPVIWIPIPFGDAHHGVLRLSGEFKHGQISLSFMVTFGSLITIHGPFGFDIFFPEIVSPAFGYSGPVTGVRLVIRGP